MNGSGTFLVKRFCGTQVNKCCKDIDLKTSLKDEGLWGV